jgi:predicted MPP superfamily phosphohydrolase
MQRFLKWFAIACSVLLSLIYVFVIEPSWVEVRAISLTLPHLAPEFDRYKVVQLSDIHTDRWMTPQRLAGIVDLVNRQHPDLVALTGDYVTRGVTSYIPYLTPLAHLAPKDGTLAVLGNHDYIQLAAPIVRTLQQAGVKLLKNQVYSLQRGNARLHIAGVDDVFRGSADLVAVLRQLPATGAAVMLAHEPDFADQTVATQRFDLQLSGHSHGGQVQLPFLPSILPPLAYKYPSGLYHLQNMLQYTNRGVGMVQPRVRLNCRPEVTVLTLRSPSHSAESVPRRPRSLQ